MQEKFPVEDQIPQKKIITRVNNKQRGLFLVSVYTLPPSGANEVEIMAKPNRDNGRECALRITKCSRQIYGSTSSHLE